MNDLHEYLDYRDYLKDFLAELRNQKSWCSYRWAAKQLEMDPGLLIRILQKKRHLSLGKSIVAIKFLSLSPNDAKYFEALILFNKAKTDSEIQKTYDYLSQLKSLDLPRVGHGQLRFYDKWYFNALRSLLSVVSFNGKNYSALAKLIHPEISVGEIKEGIKLLQKVGLIKKNDNGYYEATDSFVSGGGDWKMIAVRQFQRQAMELSIRSLEQDEPEVRDISSLTLSIPIDALPYIKESLAEYRRKILSQVADMENPEVVYQLNLQLIPLSKPLSQKSRR